MANEKTAPKKVASHPKYSEMISQAIVSLKERTGSSRAAILKYILDNFNVGGNPTAVNAHIKLALKRGVANGTLKQVKGWYLTAFYIWMARVVKSWSVNGPSRQKFGLPSRQKLKAKFWKHLLI